MDRVSETYTYEELVLFSRQYLPHDSKTWPFFPIVMPTKWGRGPVSDKECDLIEWEVWDQFCTSYAKFRHLTDAIEAAMVANKEVMLSET